MNVQEFSRARGRGRSGQALIGRGNAPRWQSAANRYPGERFLPNCSGTRRPTIWRATSRKSSPPSPSNRGAFFAQRARRQRRRSRSIRRRGLPGVAVLDIVNDDMPFLVDSVVGELNQRGLDISLAGASVFSVERDAAGSPDRVQAARQGRASAKASFTSTSTVRRTPRQRADVVPRARSDPRRGAPVRAGLAARCWRGCAKSSPNCGQTRRRFRLPRSPKRSSFSNGSPGTISRCSVRAIMLSPATARVLEPDFATGLGLLRSPEMRPLQRWNQPLTITPEIRAFLEQPRLLIVTKSTMRSRVHRRARSRLYRRQALRPRRQAARRTPVLRPVHLDRLYALGPRHSLSAAQGRQRHPPRRLRAEQPFRQGAGQRAGDLSARRAVSDRGRQLYDFALAILQLDERPRVRVLPRRDRFDRFVSVLVYVPRDRYDSQIRALIGDYLAATYKGVVRAFYPFFPGRPAGARAFHHRARRGRDAASRPRRRSTARSRPSCAVGPTA